MYLKTKGLVLRFTPYKDADAILNVLTADHGLMTFKAGGVRKNQSTLKSACQLLCYSEFTVFEKSGRYTIREASAIEMFPTLRGDLEKLSLASYFAQVAEVLSQEDAPQEEILPLTLNAIYALCKLELPKELIKAVFELRALSVSGFQPDLSGCAVCGKPFPDRFNVSEGCLVCSTCAGAGLRLPISVGVLEAMRHIVSCESKKIFSFTLDAASVSQLSGVTEAYLLTQFERGFSALDFYKSLLIT